MEFNKQFSNHFDAFNKTLDEMVKCTDSISEYKNYDECFYNLYNLKGESSNYHNSTNCFMVSTRNGILNDKVYIDIYPARIEIGSPYITGGRPVVEINTEEFTDSSDDQIFMQSTIQDLSIFDGNHQLFKKILDYSLMAMRTYRKIQDES